LRWVVIVPTGIPGLTGGAVAVVIPVSRTLRAAVDPRVQVVDRRTPD